MHRRLLSALLVAAACPLAAQEAPATPPPPRGSFVARAWDWFAASVVLHLGLTARRGTLDVEGRGGTDFTARMSTTASYAPYVMIGFDNAYFGDTALGYSFLFGYSRFQHDLQEVDGQDKDLGTEVIGDYVHLTPVIYYNFGARQIEPERWSFQIGLGIGLGFLSARGEAIDPDTGVRHDVDVRSDPLSLSYAGYLEGRYGHWFLRFQSDGPRLEDEDFRYAATSVGLTAGYSFTF